MSRCYKSGNPTGGEPPGRQRVYAQVQPFGGTWKVTTLVVAKVGTSRSSLRARKSSRLWVPGMLSSPS